MTKNMLKDIIKGNFAMPKAINHVHDIVTWYKTYKWNEKKEKYNELEK